MANAKLHIICGNCGCNSMFIYDIETDLNVNNKEYRRVSITCINCSTIHCLEDNADQK